MSSVLSAIELLGIERVCRQWAEVLGAASLGGGIAILIAWAICRGVAPIPPGVKCWVWRAALLKLLIGLVWVTPVVIPVFASTAKHVRDLDLTIAPRPIMAGADRIEANTPVVASLARKDSPREVWAIGVIALWIAGMGALGAMYGRRWLATRRLRRRCRTVNSAAVASAYEKMVGPRSIARGPGLLECAGVSGPLVLGVWKPVIVVPEGFDRCGGRKIEAMLAHELSHFDRRDMGWAGLAMLARVVFWFHPLAWLAERELAICQESACDQSAMQAIGVQPAEYGRMLLEVAVGSFKSPRLIGLAVVSSYSILHRRLSAMGHLKAWSVRRRATAGMVLLAVGVCGIVPWRLTAQQPGGTDGGVAVARTEDRTDRGGTRHEFAGNVLTNAITVRASRDGVVRTVLIKGGDRVKKLDELARFESGAVVAAVEEAEAVLAKDQLLLSEEQRNAQAVSRFQIASAKADVASDEARLAMRQQDVNALTVRAPMDGVVSEMKVHEGEFVSKGTALMTVVSVKDPRVGFLVPEAIFPKLGVGEPVEFKTAPYPTTFTGRVQFISPVADTASGTVEVRADIDDPGERLRAGLLGEVSVWVK